MQTFEQTALGEAGALRSTVMQVMQIQDTTYGGNAPARPIPLVLALLNGDQTFTVRFRGRLVMDSQEAYARVADQFRPLGYTPLFRKDSQAPEGAQHVILAVRGVMNPAPSRVWVNFLLFGLTVLSVLYIGASYGYQSEVLPSTFNQWLAFVASGVPFLVCMLGILLAHELGHYFAARYHKVEVTLPYFIPMPLPPFGTMGAFIQLKAPPTNRRVLLDIGVAGPLAGFVVAVPVLIIGLLTSPVQHIPVSGQAVSFEGNSILYILAKYLVFGKWLPIPADFGGLPPALYMLRYYLLGIPLPLGGEDVTLNSVAWAGWGGLLVTGMNLIPVGQLDGGHALYVLIGRRARLALPIILVVLVILGFFYPGWFIWAALIFFLVGRGNAEPLDQITDLDGNRKLLAILALVIFVLVITPIPLRVNF